MILDRRSYLYSIATTIAVTSVAGCLGDDEPFERDGDVVITDEEFAVEYLVFATDEAEEFGDYEAVTETVYEPGERVWLYSEPTGVGIHAPDDADRGDILVTLEITLRDQAGEELLSGEEEFTESDVPVDQRPDFWVTPWVQLGDVWPPGEYTVDLEFVDEYREETVRKSETFTVADAYDGPFEWDDYLLVTGDTFDVTKVVFTADEPTGFDEYEERVEPAYEPGEFVWTYAEPTGYAILPAEPNAGLTEITMTIALRDRFDELLVTDTDTFTLDVVTDEDPQVWLTPWAKLPEWTPPGPHELEVEFVDEQLEESVVVTRTFTVEDAPQTVYDEVREDLLAELDTLGLTVSTVAFEDDVLFVEYETAAASETQPWVDEIVFVASFYAGALTRGLDLERLAVQTHAGDETTHHWSVETETAWRFVREQLTAEQLLEHVFDSMQTESDS